MNPLAIPHLTDYISDFASILTAEQKQSLDTLFRDHETQTTEQVVTVLFPHREWHELLDIWLKVFNENGIGQKNLNNGLLLIVATEEKKLRIIVGKWLELKYTEMVCRDIIENHLRPLLNEGKYEEMINWFIHIISRKIEIEAKPKSKTISKKWILLPIFLILGFISLNKAFPENCKYTDTSIQDEQICERIIFWKKLEYTIHIYNNSYSSSSSSDWSSSDSSSSFDGGGWSSNGGGWGD